MYLHGHRKVVLCFRWKEDINGFLGKRLIALRSLSNLDHMQLAPATHTTSQSLINTITLQWTFLMILCCFSLLFCCSSIQSTKLIATRQFAFKTRHKKVKDIVIVIIIITTRHNRAKETDTVSYSQV